MIHTFCSEYASLYERRENVEGFIFCRWVLRKLTLCKLDGRYLPPREHEWPPSESSDECGHNRRLHRNRGRGRARRRVYGSVSASPMNWPYQWVIRTRIHPHNQRSGCLPSCCPLSQSPATHNSCHRTPATRNSILHSVVIHPKTYVSFFKLIPITNFYILSSCTQRNTITNIRSDSKQSFTTFFSKKDRHQIFS